MSLLQKWPVPDSVSQWESTTLLKDLKKLVLTCMLQVDAISHYVCQKRPARLFFAILFGNFGTQGLWN